MRKLKNKMDDAWNNVSDLSVLKNTYLKECMQNQSFRKESKETAL